MDFRLRGRSLIARVLEPTLQIHSIQILKTDIPSSVGMIVFSHALSPILRPHGATGNRQGAGVLTASWPLPVIRPHEPLRPREASRRSLMERPSPRPQILVSALSPAEDMTPPAQPTVHTLLPMSRRQALILLQGGGSSMASLGDAAFPGK